MDDATRRSDVWQNPAAMLATFWLFIFISCFVGLFTDYVVGEPITGVEMP